MNTKLSLVVAAVLCCITFSSEVALEGAESVSGAKIGQILMA